MKKWFKRIVIGTATLALVAVVGAALFLLTFDPNTYARKLEEAVLEKYQRVLTIEGDVELSLFPRIGLTLTGVSLSEPGSEATFASVDRARVAVAIWPLLSNSLVIDNVMVEGFGVNIVRNERGQLNFQDLLDGPADAPAADAPADPKADDAASHAAASGSERVRRSTMQIDIAGLDLRQGEIAFVDQASGTHVKLANLAALAGRVTFRQPFDFSLTGRLEGDAPHTDADLTANAVLMLDPDAMKYAVQKLDVQVTGALGRATAEPLSLRGNLTYDAVERAFRIGSGELAFRGQVETGEGLLEQIESGLSMPAAELDLSSKMLSGASLAARAKGQRAAESFEFALDLPKYALGLDEVRDTAATARFRLFGAGRTLDAQLNLAPIQGEKGVFRSDSLSIDASLEQQGRKVGMALVSPAQFDTGETHLSMPDLTGQAVLEADDASLTIPLDANLQIKGKAEELALDLAAVLEPAPAPAPAPAAESDADGDTAAGDVAAEAAEPAKPAPVIEGPGRTAELKATLKKWSAEPAFDINLKAGRLDLDRLLPFAVAFAAAEAPQPQSEEGADAAGQEAAGQADAAADKTDTEPTAEQPATAPAVTAQDKAAQPEKPRTVYAGKVQLAVQQLIFQGQQIDDISAQATLRPHDLQVSRFGLRAYGSALTGKLSLGGASAEPDQWHLTLQGKGLEMQPLLSHWAGFDYLSGAAELQLDLRGQGLEPAYWLNTLSGKARLRMPDGKLHGIDLGELARLDDLLQRKGVLSAGDGVARLTEFKALDAALTFDSGIGTIDRLTFSHAAVTFRNSSGRLDLPAGTLDLTTTARLNNVSISTGGVKTTVKRLDVPLRISGPWSGLNYQVQWQGLAEGALKGALAPLLQGLLPGSESAAPDAAATPAEPAASASGSARQRVEDLGKALKGLFGK
ncbi:MAG: AsmA family protein [Corticimicrobacter sp.]|uniref:AsmA family protein n=1 Tax=Corticimicrobacter sp. TaxID=2678536 RepID=UPI0032DB8047